MTNDPSVRKEQIMFKYRRDVLMIRAEKGKKDLDQINHDIEILRSGPQKEIGSIILIRRLFRKLEEIERGAQHETSQRYSETRLKRLPYKEKPPNIMHKHLVTEFFVSHVEKK